MQPTSCLSTVINVFFCFRWRRVWNSFYSGGSADPCAVFCMYILQQACQGTRHIFFLISWRSNKVSFETLCEDEGLSKLKSWIRCGSSCHVISPSVFMLASKTRARLSDLEKKCLREKLPHAIFNTLPSDFFFFWTAVARYEFELMNVMLIWGSSKNERPWVTECYYCTIRRCYQNHLHFWLSSVLVSYS